MTDNESIILQQIGDDQFVAHGEAATEPTKPVIPGYTAGATWDKPFSSITGPIDVYCDYTLNEYSVRFIEIIDDQTHVFSEQFVKHGTLLSDVTRPADPTREGHTFTGWSDPTPPEALNENRQVVGHCVITAQFVAKVSVDFYDKNGTLLSSELVDTGTKLGTLTQFSNIPEWTNHRFRSWGSYNITTSKWNFDVTADTKAENDLSIYPDYWIDWNFHGAEAPTTPIYSDDESVVYRLSRAFFADPVGKYSYYTEGQTAIGEMTESIPPYNKGTSIEETWTFSAVMRSDGVIFEDDGIEITSGVGTLLMYDNEDFYCKYKGVLNCVITLAATKGSVASAYTKHKVAKGVDIRMYKCESVTYSHNVTAGATGDPNHTINIQLRDAGLNVLYNSVTIMSYNSHEKAITLPNSAHPDWIISGSTKNTTERGPLEVYEAKDTTCPITWDVSTTFNVEIGDPLVG